MASVSRVTLLKKVFAGLLAVALVLSGACWLAKSNRRRPRYRGVNVLDTPACQIPQWDPFDPSVAGYYVRSKGPYPCPPESSPSFLSLTAPDVVDIDRGRWGGGELPACSYRPIRPDRKDGFQLGPSRPLPLGKPVRDDYLDVECRLGGRKVLHDILTLVPERPALDRNLEALATAAAPGPPADERLNVLLLGIDSLSKLNFLRHFPETLRLLRHELGALELHGYNKVGDNSFPNLIPLLTGRPGKAFAKFARFDGAGFLWDAYATRGYRTLYAEDMTSYGTFNAYGRRGFELPPVHHYLRPASMAMEASAEALDHCYRGRVQAEFYWDYLRTFLRAMRPPRNFFAFVFVSRLVHNELNHAGYLDAPASALLRHLRESGVLNTTALFFFSDHGIRFGPLRATELGQYEERLPIAFLAFPEWFLRRRGHARRHLEANQRRLVTLFDVHATLLQLLNVTGPPPGLSLLSPVPETRTCAQAGIPDAHCACNLHQAEEDARSDEAARALVSRINAALDTRLCHELRLTSVRSARSSAAALGTRRYLLVVQTSPGNALFEGVVWWDAATDAFRPSLEISRLNLYGNTSSCVQDADQRKFCYCRSATAHPPTVPLGGRNQLANTM